MHFLTGLVFKKGRFKEPEIYFKNDGFEINEIGIVVNGNFSLSDLEKVDKSILEKAGIEITTVSNNAT
mgnify:FL=1